MFRQTNRATFILKNFPKATARAVAFFCTRTRRGLAAMTAAAMVLATPGLADAFALAAPLGVVPSAASPEAARPLAPVTGDRAAGGTAKAAIECFQALFRWSISLARPVRWVFLTEAAVSSTMGLLRINAMGRKTKETKVPNDCPCAEGGCSDTPCPEAQVTTYTYDAAGNLTSQTDPSNNTTTYEYDALNRLVKTTDAEGHATKYAYDSRDNLLSLSDANNHTTTFEYSPNNQVTKERKPMGEETNYEYDGFGNLSKKTDAKGQLTEYKYDATGHLTETDYYASGGTGVPPVKTVTFTYDTAGNLTGYTDGTSSATYDYDQGRKVGETVNYGAFSQSFGYTYDTSGKRPASPTPTGQLTSSPTTRTPN
jgi:YD repeat-containing protein